MTITQEQAINDLRRIAMNHVKIAAKLDGILQSIEREIENESPEWVALFIKSQQQYLQDYKKSLGEPLNGLEYDAWKKLLATF